MTARRESALAVKVVFVVGTLERGGSERQIVEFVRAAHPEHARCVVVCQGEEGPLASEVRAAGARVLTLGMSGGRGAGRVLRLARGVARLGAILREENADVIYAFLFWGYGIALPVALLASPKACRVQGRRSLPDADLPRRRMLRPVRRIADRCSHGAIANSVAVGRAVAAAEPEMAGRLWVVPNGVRRVDQTTSDPRAQVTLVAVANLKPNKGHATLIEASRRIAAGPWSLLLVGDGPERDNIESLLASAGLRDRVRLLGRREDVNEILNSADIAVLASYSEGMPNAVLEAMAHGLPVVASDVGGVRGLLETGAGIVVPPRDACALAQAMQSLIDDRELRRRLGARGREFVLRRMSVESMRDSTLLAFRQIEECRGARSAG